METIKGTYKSEDGHNYYELALNLKTGDKVLIENASCTAVAQELAEKYFSINSSLYIPNNVKIFFLGTSPEIDLKKIPKKYHKFM